MPQTIQIKRGLNTNFNSVTLLPGEPAFTTDTGKLYIGDGTAKILINPTYGTAANANTGTASGNVPVLDSNGKLLPGIMPAISLTETFVVSSQTAMLSLTANVGDVAIRTDLNETFILQTDPANVVSNWVKLLTSPGAITSVNGLTGAVVLGGNNVFLNSYAKAASYTSIVPADSVNIAIAKLERRTDSLAPISSPAFLGTPTAHTAPSSTNDNTLATTAFVKGQGYLTTAPVSSVNTKTGAVVLVTADILMTGYSVGSSAAIITTADTLGTAIGKLEYGKASLISPTFSGTPVAPTASLGTNTTQLATTAFVQAAVSSIDGGTF